MGSKHEMKSTRARFGGRRVNSHPDSRLYFSRGQNTAVVLSLLPPSALNRGMVEVGGTPGCPAPRPAPSADLHGGGTSSCLGSPCQHPTTLQITKWFGRKSVGSTLSPTASCPSKEHGELCKEHPPCAVRGRASLGEEDHHLHRIIFPTAQGRSAEKSRASFTGGTNLASPLHPPSIFPPQGAASTYAAVWQPPSGTH